MCGISGLLSSTKIDRRDIKAMNDAIIHRGPDAEGITSLYNDRVLLGHRRLSIIDLSDDANQPMYYDDNKLCIVYNGELYNYIELRVELRKLGHSFHTNSDTEVILAAYKQWGKSALKRFNGMWAFIIIDKNTNTLFASRDNFGIKPLYFWLNANNDLAFASEIKQFTTLPTFKAKLNNQKGFEFLNYSMHDHTHETLFAGVKQLQAGEYLELCLDFEKLDQFRIVKWYMPNYESFQGSFEEASLEFYSLLEDSIRLRLRSDVAVGMSLSGGLDSSSIVCLTNKLDPNKQHQSFSIASEYPQFDESEYFQEVIQNTNIEANIITPKLSELLEEYKKMTYYHDEPFVSTSIFAEWSVYKQVHAKNLKVILDGHGADEILAGYHPFKSRKLASSLKQLNLMSLFGDMHGFKKHHGMDYNSSLKILYSLLAPNKLKQHFRKKNNLAHENPEWCNTHEFHIKDANPFRSYPSSNINELSKMNLFYYSMPSQLHWADRDSMTHSVESRIPFLDHRVVEFLLSLPDSYKLDKGVHKRVLRHSLKELLPSKILNRHAKMGFETAEEMWIKKENKAFFEKRFLDAVDQSNGLLNEHAIQKYYKMVNSQIPFDFFIWKIISFGQWIETFNVKVEKE